MDVGERQRDSAVERRLTQELHELRTAIEVVRGGSVERIGLSGLRFGEQLLKLVCGEARRQGVTIEPRWWPEDAGCDIVVRRSTEDR